MFRQRTTCRCSGAACWIALICIATASCLGEAKFPTDPSLPYKFGVFIGINKYPHLREEEQLDGCVNDAQTMQRLFADQFQVKRSVLLTDEQATRQGIGQALNELYRQVKLAREKTQGQIDVVITYSGHGCRVERLPEEHDPNALDDAWVASDSSRSFDQVVRGHELLKLHTALANLNVQVVIISDSCFSGSGYRGLEYAKTRSIRDGAVNAQGPQDDLFPDLPSAAAVGSALQVGDQPLAGFVYYAACGDHEEAHEWVDPATKQPSGRLSYAIADILRQPKSELTYDQLAGNITVKFNALWPDQHPEFHAAPGKGSDLFLHAGQRPPLNARILGTADESNLELSLGSLDGVSSDSHFRFYASLDDLMNHANPIGTAAVVRLLPATCIVRPADGANFPLDARAALDGVGEVDFVVGLDNDIPKPIIDKLQEMEKNGQIKLAQKEGPCSVAVHYHADQQTVGFYLPGELPGGQKKAKPLRMVGYRSAGDAGIVGENLLYVARVQRIMTLKPQGGRSLAAAEIECNAASPTTQPADGLTHVREGTPLLIKLTNKTNEVPLYFWVFFVGNDGSLATLYPMGGKKEPIPAGHSIEVGRVRALTASIEKTDPVPSGGAELTKLKVIATTRYVDLERLTIAPSTNMSQQVAAKGVPAKDDPFVDLMIQATQGSRGIGVSQDTVWDTCDAAIDVIKN